MLGNRKMSVISGCGAEELYLVKPAPGSVSENTVGICPGNGVVHYIERCVAADDNVLRPGLHDISHELLSLGNTVELSVVSCIYLSV